MRLPGALRLYRRYEEIPQGEDFVHQPFPDRPIPTQKKERARFPKDVDPVVLQDPAFQKLHPQVRTKSDVGIALLAAASRPKVPVRVLLFDSW